MDVQGLGHVYVFLYTFCLLWFRSLEQLDKPFFLLLLPLFFLGLHLVPFVFICIMHCTLWIYLALVEALVYYNSCNFAIRIIFTIRDFFLLWYYNISLCIFFCTYWYLHLNVVTILSLWPDVCMHKVLLSWEWSMGL